MKGLFLLISGLMISFSGMAQEYNVLAYEPGKKLTWQDFQGRPHASDAHKGAEITVTIFLKLRETSFWSGGTSYDAYAVAFKNESWVKPGYKDDYTLKHEQIHFDIAHLYAEMLEIEINNLDKKTIRQKDQVEKMLNEKLAQMQAHQNRYDRETYGGNNYAKQKKWSNKIAKALKIINTEAEV